MKLYELDAQGIADDELVDKVGYRLYERCRDCLTVSGIATGDAYCPMCREALEIRGEGAARSLRCYSCGWASDWETFHRSWRHMELFSAGMRPFFEEFIASWLRARSYPEKTLAINDVIHRWHWENVLADRGSVGRPGCVNLIEGSRKQVIAFLERLSSGPEHDRWAGLKEAVDTRNERSH